MKNRVITLRVNGTRHEVLIPPHKTLLEVLREELGLTGTKFGCELGECGVCTVLVDEQPALSCSTLAALCDGKEITTVEGLSGRAFEIVEQAFREEGASQCGYCTPSMVLMVQHLIERGDAGEATDELAGNICRCTGYTKIIKAYDRCRELANE